MRKARILLAIALATASAVLNCNSGYVPVGTYTETAAADERDCDQERRRAEARGLELLKSLEGLRLTAYHDVTAYRIGYGTPAAHAQERITVDEADQRVRARYLRECAYMRTAHPHLTEPQIAALAVMRFNVGSFGPGLRRAVATGAPEQIAAQMSRYVKSAGEVLPGLRSRREAEIELLFADNSNLS